MTSCNTFCSFIFCITFFLSTKWNYFDFNNLFFLVCTFIYCKHFRMKSYYLNKQTNKQTYWFSLKKGNRKNPRSGWLFNGFSVVCSTMLQCFYFCNTITTISLFPHIVQSYTYELKRGISFIRFSLSYYNQVYHKTCYFNHWQIISQGLTWYWGHDYEFRTVLHNDKHT